MSDIISNGTRAEAEGRAGLRKRLVPIGTVLLAVGITVILFLYRDQVSQLGNYGYLGAFLVSLISNATIIIPTAAPTVTAYAPLGTLNITPSTLIFLILYLTLPE